MGFSEFTGEKAVGPCWAGLSVRGRRYRWLLFSRWVGWAPGLCLAIMVVVLTGDKVTSQRCPRDVNSIVIVCTSGSSSSLGSVAQPSGEIQSEF